MRGLTASVFSLLVTFISEMLPGFFLENQADRAMFYMLAWLCGYELFKKSDK